MGKTGDVVSIGAFRQRSNARIVTASPRCGARVIYYWFVSDEVILMLFAFAKNEQADLTPDQRKQLKKPVEGELK